MRDEFADIIVGGLDDDLLAALDVDTANAPPEVIERVEAAKARFVIESEDDAAKALASLVAAQDRVAELEAQARHYQARLDGWKAEATGPWRRRIDAISAMLTPWARDQRERRRAATFKLPSGTISTSQKSEPTIVVTDEAAFLAWLDSSWTTAEVNAITKRSVRLTEMRKAFTIVTTADNDGAVHHRVVDPSGGVPAGLAVEDPKVSVSFKARPAL